LPQNVPMFENPTFWVAASFFGFLLLLAYFKVPGMIAKVLDERAASIKVDIDEARKLRDNAEKLLADYKAKRAAAEEEARVIVENARREAEAMAVEARNALRESLDRRTRMAEDKIKRAETQAIAEVRALAVDRAVTAAEKVLQDTNTAANDAGFVAEGIKSVKARMSR
jgi:F-type H+-transporting ATPase subunit b